LETSGFEFFLFNPKMAIGGFQNMCNTLSTSLPFHRMHLRKLKESLEIDLDEEPDFLECVNHINYPGVLPELLNGYVGRDNSFSDEWISSYDHSLYFGQFRKGEYGETIYEGAGIKIDSDGSILEGFFENGLLYRGTILSRNLTMVCGVFFRPGTHQIQDNADILSCSDDSSQ
jgi:hypothetical protein